MSLAAATERAQPAASTAHSPSADEQSPPANEAPAADPSSVMKKIVETLHRDRPVLAAALAKLSSVTHEGDDMF